MATAQTATTPTRKRRTATKAAPKRKAPAKKTEADKKKEAAQREADRIAKQAAKEEIKKTTEKKLVPVAREISVRMDKAMQYAEKADDHRLAASIALENARIMCKEGGVAFQAWCTENLPWTWENTRKLLPIGKAEAEQPGAGKQMLEDLRTANREANRRHRERKKLEKQHREAAADGKAPEPKKKPAERAFEAYDQMGKSERKKFIESKMEEEGMHVVPDHVKEEVEEVLKDKPMDRAKKAFERFKTTKEKLTFLRWAAEQIEHEVVPIEYEDDDEEENDDEEQVNGEDN